MTAFLLGLLGGVTGGLITAVFLPTLIYVFLRHRLPKRAP